VIVDYLSDSSITIKMDEHLAVLGMDSIRSKRLHALLSQKLGPQDESLMYAGGTPQDLLNYMLKNQPSTANTHKVPTQERPKPSKSIVPSSIGSGEIAVVGMGLRYAHATTANEFWELLTKGECTITKYPKQRADLLNVEGHEKLWGSFITQPLDQFDNMFFSILQAESDHMDPQQRLLLEVTVEALHNAGYSVKNVKGSKSGVYIGAHYTDYAACDTASGVYTATGASFSILANRISYYLDWHGPSITHMTACSSSLVAVTNAVEHLRTGKCDFALAGGVQLNLIAKPWQDLHSMGLLSPDGRCCPFDVSANGIVRGEGCGLVVLKRLEDAIRDKNTILGCISGIAVNHGGLSQHLTAPNAAAQKQVPNKKI
jgi:acyl transferase domain-containing protein